MNLLTFGGDPLPDTDSGSLFHFPHYFGIWDFRGFDDLLAFLYSHRPIFPTLGDMTDADRVMNPRHIGSDPADIRPNPDQSGNRDSNSGSLLAEILALGEVCAL